MSQLTTRESRVQPPTRLEYATPAVDLHHDNDGFTLEVEMPGVEKDGVEITFEEGKLTLSGHRAPRAAGGKAVYAESSGRAYRRIFDLDPAIDPSKIQASIEQGLLTVRLPKAEASKPRKINVG